MYSRGKVGVSCTAPPTFKVHREGKAILIEATNFVYVKTMYLEIW